MFSSLNCLLHGNRRQFLYIGGNRRFSLKRFFTVTPFSRNSSISFFSPFSSSRVQRNRLLSSEVKTRLWFYFEFSKAAAAAAADVVAAAAAADVEVFGVL